MVKAPDAATERAIGIAHLRRGIKHLVGPFALAAIWSGNRSSRVLRKTTDAVFAILQLDFALLEVTAGEGSPKRYSQLRSEFRIRDAAALGQQLRRLLGEEPRAWPAVSRRRLFDRELTIAVAGIGVDREFGVLVAASMRPGFPNEAEKLLLSVAGSQAFAASREVHLHPADELEDLVAQRTRDLAETNAALKRELAELTRAEEALRARELTANSLIDGLPGFVAVLGPDGSVERVNRQIEEYCGQTLAQLKHWGTNGTVHPDDLPHVAQIFGESIAAGVPYAIEQRLRRFDGEYRWFVNRGHPEHDESGRIVAWHVLLTDIDDRKRVERELAASQRSLQQTIDSIPALAWSARADGSGNFFNQHYLDYVGLSQQDVSDWQWARVIHPDDLSVIFAAWESFRTAGAGGEVEARVRRHDGVYRWFQFRANPLRNEDGEIVSWHGVNVDIEEQKRASLMLAGEKQLLELIAAGRSLPDVLRTLCTVVEAASPACHCEVRTIAVSSSTFEFAVAPSLPQGFLGSIAGTAVRDDLSPCGVSACANAQVIVHDIAADARWTETSTRDRLIEHGLRSAWCTPISTNGGKILGTLCLYHCAPSSPQPEHRDIIGRAVHIASIAIERLRADDELRRRDYLLTTAERLSETGSFSWDLNNNKLVWSTQMYRIHELDEGAELAYPNLLTTVHPDDLQTVTERISRLFKGEGSPDFGYRLLMPDGRVKHLSTAYEVIDHGDGRRECVGVAQDVTRSRLAEDALDKVRSELAHITRVTSLGELAASIAHEVNQPLSGIITNASTCLLMLAAEPPNLNGAIATMQRTIRDADRASEVIRKLRGLFRKHDFSPEPLNLNEAAQEVIAICSHDLQRRRIGLNVNVDEGLPFVFGDRIQLQQVILNLILNAADAIGGIDQQRPRHIWIETARITPELAQLTVRDTGAGIAAKDFEKIFEAFYTTKPNGMGIGLSVSKSILDRHGGKLWASSNDGPGATFAFSVPCLRVADRPLAVQATHSIEEQDR